MTPDTRAALIELWTRWPECKPERIVHHFGLSDNPIFHLSSKYDAAILTYAEAAVLACDAIEQWLLTLCRLCLCCPNIHGTRGLGDIWTITVTSWQVQFSTVAHPEAGGCVEGPTKLSALIRAANAVLDAKGSERWIWLR